MDHGAVKCPRCTLPSFLPPSAKDMMSNEHALLLGKLRTTSLFSAHVSQEDHPFIQRDAAACDEMLDTGLISLSTSTALHEASEKSIISQVEAYEEDILIFHVFYRKFTRLLQSKQMVTPLPYFSGGICGLLKSNVM